jgi:uncharacterized membrane protein YdjX (TVP38/TMEM64 family)
MVSIHPRIGARCVAAIEHLGKEPAMPKQSDTAAPKTGGSSGLAVAPPAWRRYMSLLVLAGLMALVFAMGWHRLLTLDGIAANRDALQASITRNWPLAMLGYAALYAAVVALSLPGASVMTLSGGLLFGWFFGGLAAIVGATLGATAIFLIARSAFGETLRAKAGPSIAKLQDGFKEDAMSYLLFLRLVPAFPFWLVNLAPALLGVPLVTYVIATFIGIIPGTFAFASVGAGLDSVISAAKAEHATCIAAKSAAACKLSINAGSLITKELLFAFAALGVTALIPVALKKWRNPRAKS